MARTEIQKLVDITSRKHGGVSTSTAAHSRILTQKESQREQVFELIAAWPKTSKEIADEMGTELHHISGRISELLAHGRIEDTGERRRGCRVMRIAGRSDAND